MIDMRTMTVAELTTVLDWAADEGWNPGLDDARAFFAADPAGFFVAEDGGAPVAAISVVNHSPDFAFLGLYLCRPSHRGRGIGHALWRHALTHAGDRTVGLDGVPDQQANYLRSGFDLAGGTTRFSGRVRGAEHSGIRPATAEDIPGLIAAEAEVSGWSKPAYLSAWFRNTATRTTFVLGGGGGVDGFATVRACRTGAKIGPLVVMDGTAALALVERAASAFGEEVILDVPAGSAPLQGLCADLGMTPGFHTARMYRGGASTPKADWYGVATLELG